MAIDGVSVTVGTTATLLIPTLFTNQINYNQRGMSLLIQNTSSVTVYIGGSDVTSSLYGYALATNQSLAVDLYADEKIYAAVASGTQTIRVLRQGV